MEKKEENNQSHFQIVIHNVELEEELAMLKRIEEEFSVVKLSLEEQLVKRESEMDLNTNNLQNERQTLKQALDNPAVTI